MDPLTHALAGSAAARVLLSRPLGAAALLPGAAGALLPDADALIRSTADPLLYAEFHRHFTHSLLLIPVGGVVAGLPWALARRTRARWKAFLGAATAGYATHGVLDASTTYGTLLLWPFSDLRVGWDIIAIVDPLFTLMLLAGVTLSLLMRSATPPAVAVLLCTGYLAFGVIQRDRALAAQADLAASRGHALVRNAVFPGFGQNVVWRSLYQAGGTLHMDRLRVPWTGGVSWRRGTTVPLFRSDEAPAHWRDDVRVAHDLRRFHWFADGWVARAPDEDELIADARYSDAPDRFEPVWGVRIAAGPAGPAVTWVDRSRERRVDPRALWNELLGRDPEYRPVPR